MLESISGFVFLVDCSKDRHTCITLEEKAHELTALVVVRKNEVYASEVDWNVNSLDRAEVPLYLGLVF